MQNKIAGYRRMLGLTQVEMAKRLGVSVTAYFNKEHGRTPFTDKEKVLIRDMVKEVDEDVSIDKLFF